MHIGEAIERRREAMDMSKTELAARIGVDRTHIYKLIVTPTIDTGTLRRICMALDMNFFQVLSDDMDVQLGKRDVPGSGNSARISSVRIVIEVGLHGQDADKAAVSGSTGNKEKDT